MTRDFHCRPLGIGLIFATLTVLATVLFFRAFAHAEEAAKETWTDGMCRYEISLPLEGYYVPFENLKFDMSPGQVFALARKMTAEELARYGREDDPPVVTAEYPLFVFKNHGANVFLWKGHQAKDRRVIPRVWNGTIWHNRDGAGTAVERLIYLPRQEERCYVLLDQNRDREGQDRTRTDRIFFGAFPPLETVVRQGMETSDVVVFRPPDGWANLQEGGMLDCLKGNLSLAEFHSLPRSQQIKLGAYVFIDWTGDNRKIRWSFCDGEFVNDYGPMRFEYMERDRPAHPWLEGYLDKGLLRWRLAKSARDPQKKDADCQLRVVNPGAAQGAWTILEFAAGSTRPSELFQRPQMRHQRDGGNPLFSIQVRQGETTAELAPEGRFGLESLQRKTPEENAALGLEYQFIASGAGVMKLALRPKRYPWEAVVQGRSLSDGSEPRPKTSVTEEVTVKLK